MPDCSRLQVTAQPAMMISSFLCSKQHTIWSNQQLIRWSQIQTIIDYFAQHCSWKSIHICGRLPNLLSYHLLCKSLLALHDPVTCTDGLVSVLRDIELQWSIAKSAMIVKHGFVGQSNVVGLQPVPNYEERHLTCVDGLQWFRLLFSLPASHDRIKND